MIDNSSLPSAGPTSTVAFQLVLVGSVGGEAGFNVVGCEIPTLHDTANQSIASSDRAAVQLNISNLKIGIFTSGVLVHGY